LKETKFDKKASEDDFYRWASLRSSYLAEANIDAARRYLVGSGGPGWYGTGWYWDPSFSAYTFVPAAGIFYDPFGWGFYSPWMIYGAPYVGFGYGYGGYYHRFGPGYHPPFYARGGGRTGFSRGGFVGTGGGFGGRTGGFSRGGAAGGFHGGGGIRGGGHR
jgi:hypothetical protein